MRDARAHGVGRIRTAVRYDEPQRTSSRFHIPWSAGVLKFYLATPKRRSPSTFFLRRRYQTDLPTANIILETQQKKPGLAGDGIYLATTPELTGHKAHRTGVILEATVALGRIHTLDANGDPNMTLQKLKAKGFDSVCIARPVSSGQEYVVYDPEQVLRIVEADQQGVASSRSPPPPPPPPPTVVHAAPVGRSGIPMRNVSRPTGAQKVAGIPMRNVDRM